MRTAESTAKISMAVMIGIIAFSLWMGAMQLNKTFSKNKEEDLRRIIREEFTDLCRPSK